MAVVRVRLLGGQLNGQVLWVEEGRPILEVNVAGKAGVSSKLRYKVDGGTAQLVTEPETPPVIS